MVDFSKNIPRQSFRFERKFFVSSLMYSEVENIILRNYPLFREVFHIRKINNIYFDDFKLSNYYDNIAGIANRQKARLRWYGDLEGSIAKSQFELKIKKGLLGGKMRYDVNIDFSLSRGIDKKILKKISSSFEDNFGLLNYVAELKPILLNRYTRKYFLSGCGKYRLTLDTDLSYYKPRKNQSPLHINTDKYSTIVELKYAPSEDQNIDLITQNFPFNLSKSSKYVTGVELLYSF